MYISSERVRLQITSILSAWGMDEDPVRTTVDAMVYSDLAGIDSHGISMLMQYENYWRKGQLNLKGRPSAYC